MKWLFIFLFPFSVYSQNITNVVANTTKVGPGTNISNVVSSGGGGGSTEAVTPNIGAAGGSQANAGKLGIKFVVGSADITVTDLGRWVTAGNVTTHTLRLRNSSCVDIITIPSNALLGTPGSYQYSSITPTTLTHGQTYYLMDDTNGTDTYYINVPVTLSADIDSCVEAYDVGSGCNDVSASESYVPVGFKYHL